jgi:hypothetical protein
VPIEKHRPESQQPSAACDAMAEVLRRRLSASSAASDGSITIDAEAIRE